MIMETKINIIEVGDKRYSQFRETEKAVGIWDGTITVWVPKKCLKQGDVVGQWWISLVDFAQFRVSSQKFYNNLKNK
jgi:hypothetical protein